MAVTVYVPSAARCWREPDLVTDREVADGDRGAALGDRRRVGHGDRARPAVVGLERDADPSIAVIVMSRKPRPRPPGTRPARRATPPVPWLRRVRRRRARRGAGARGGAGGRSASTAGATARRRMADDRVAPTATARRPSRRRRRRATRSAEPATIAGAGRGRAAARTVDLLVERDPSAAGALGVALGVRTGAVASGRSSRSGRASWTSDGSSRGSDVCRPRSAFRASVGADSSSVLRIADRGRSVREALGVDLAGRQAEAAERRLDPLHHRTGPHR